MSNQPINPAAIPQVHGDMVALSQEAQRLRACGQAAMQRGQDVHATWQGLGGVYRAPESGQLLVATAPVRDMADRVGRTQVEVGAILDNYASEMQVIKQRLRNVKTEAEALVAEIGRFTAGQEEYRRRDEAAITLGDAFGINDATEWFDDPVLKQRHDDLLRRINQAVADRQACEVRCANAIAKVHGGRTYRVGDGDGQHQAGEYGSTAEHYNTMASEGGTPWGQSTDANDSGSGLAEAGHLVLDVVGMVPVVGEAADGLNAAWYAAEGDYLNAGLSAAAMIPIAGNAATGGKLIKKGAEAANNAYDSTRFASKGADNAAEAKQVDQRSQELQNALPENTRGRVTIGTGVGHDAGHVRRVVGSSEKNGYLRKPVADALKPDEEVAKVKGNMHAEVRILSYMKEQGITPGPVGAGRPICNQCAPAIQEAGATPASPLKGAPPRGGSS